MEEVTKKHFLLLFFFFRETDGSLPFFSLIFTPVPAASGGPKARVVIDRVKGKKKVRNRFRFSVSRIFLFSSLHLSGEKNLLRGRFFLFLFLPPSFSGPEGWWVQGRKLRFPVKNRSGKRKRSLNGRPLNASSPRSASDTDRSILRQKRKINEYRWLRYNEKCCQAKTVCL